MKTAKFKVGDIVRATETIAGPYEFMGKGEIGKVVAVFEFRNSPCYKVETPDHFSITAFGAYFELVNKGDE